MRKQNIETDIYPMEIDWGGINVHENASAFSMMGRATPRYNPYPVIIWENGP